PLTKPSRPARESRARPRQPPPARPGPAAPAAPWPAPRRGGRAPAGIWPGNASRSLAEKRADYERGAHRDAVTKTGKGEAGSARRGIASSPRSSGCPVGPFRAAPRPRGAVLRGARNRPLSTKNSTRLSQPVVITGFLG